MPPVCVQLTPDQLASSLAAGWTLVSGPYATNNLCVANCGQASSVASSVSSSAAVNYWCVAYYAGNSAPCPTSGAGCFAQSALTDIFNVGFAPGTFVSFQQGGGTCYGTIQLGPYADPTTCATNCTAFASSASSVSAQSSVSSASGAYWCVFAQLFSRCYTGKPICLNQAQIISVFPPNQSPPIQVGFEVAWVGADGKPCVAYVLSGPYPDPGTCAAQCPPLSSPSSPSSSVSSRSSTSGGTVQTACCANTLPTTLYASITPIPDQGQSIPMVWDGSQYWVANGLSNTFQGFTYSLRLSCAGVAGQLLLEMNCGAGWFTLTWTSGNCGPPLLQQWNSPSIPCGIAASISVIVTP
jgi:hypothetical protein